MRGCGILLHITSLPGPYGVGTMGKQAYRFVDFLEKAGQQYWQILPLTPTGYGDSPYQSCSTFAGNHYLIDLDTLMEQGLLTREDLAGIQWNIREDRADFGLLYQNRLRVLRKAYARFVPGEDFQAFCVKNSDWLPDFALFMALKEKTGGKSWYEWEDGLKHREPDAIWDARQALSDTVRFYQFVQYLFYTQWEKLRSYAHAHGVKIIGDVPIYVPLDSVEVWSSPELFQLDKSLRPTAVAGCPPDAFGPDGQLWGNPLYHWEDMKKDGYGWWLRRLAAAGRLYDVVRMDHFRGLESYWSVPFGDKTARNGKWVPGPGMAFIQAVQKNLPELSMIAEDLGFLTQEVLDLRDASGFPGMKVLEFAFGSGADAEYLPHNHIQNSVCYLGTHDNLTMTQWFESVPKAEAQYAIDYMNLTREEGYVWGTIRTAMASVSDLCVLQMQDCLCLGDGARMNSPGTTGCANWTWRAKDGVFTDALAEKLCRLVRIYGRLAKKPETKASTEK